MNKDDGRSFNSDRDQPYRPSDEVYYERRYRDNWNHAVRRASWSKREHRIVKKRQRAHWDKNKEKYNRNRREAWALKHTKF